jgi:phospholipid transport system substrate-binding protein
MGIHISMEILSDDSKLVILYKLREADGRWRIYDVEIEGVSILLTYRSQFDEILRRGGVKSLFDQLTNSAAK